MASRALRIGFLGPVLEASSWHACWISRAIAIARNELTALADNRVELCVSDDGASAAGARAAARMLLEQGIDAACGLFSSSAAAAAVPLLTGQGTGMVIAGANLDGLTSACDTFRICDTATGYAKWIAGVIARLPVRDIAIHLDSSEFGRSIGRMLPSQQYGQRSAGGKAIVCIGQFHFADQILRKQAASIQPGDVVLLTDDCQSNRTVRTIAEMLPGIEILVAGFSVHPAPYRTWAREAALRQWGEEPAAFFHETIASIEAAIHLALHGNLRGEIATVLGDLVFDYTREARPNRMMLYHGTAEGLSECSNGSPSF